MDISEFTHDVLVWTLQRFGEAGPRTFRALIAQFGNLEEIFNREIDELKEIEGLDDDRAGSIFNCYNHLDDARRFINSLSDRDLKNLIFSDDNYPRLFEELNDPPPIIFYKGTAMKPDERSVAIVGAQDASAEGITLTVELAKRLSEKGISIVSGLSKGIGSAAHIGAVNAKGKTYAIAATGADLTYPEDNMTLSVEIVRSGAIYSEYEPGTPYNQERSMERNRLIAGMSQAVIFGEMKKGASEAFDLARVCNEIGKIMFLALEYYDDKSDKEAVQHILDLGAIPFWIEQDFDMILKAMV